MELKMGLKMKIGLKTGQKGATQWGSRPPAPHFSPWGARRAPARRRGPGVAASPGTSSPCPLWAPRFRAAPNRAAPPSSGWGLCRSVSDPNGSQHSLLRFPILGWTDPWDPLGFRGWFSIAKCRGRFGPRCVRRNVCGFWVWGRWVWGGWGGVGGQRVGVGGPGMGGGGLGGGRRPLEGGGRR